MKKTRNLSFVSVVVLTFSLILSACSSQDNDNAKANTNTDIVTETNTDTLVYNDVADSSYEDNSQDTEEVDWGIGSKDINELAGYEYEAVKDAEIRKQERLEREEEEQRRKEQEQKRKEQEKNKRNTECDHNWVQVYSGSITSYECNGKTFSNYYRAQDEAIASGKSVTTTTTYSNTYMCSECGASREEH